VKNTVHIQQRARETNGNAVDVNDNNDDNSKDADDEKSGNIYIKGYKKTSEHFWLRVLYHRTAVKSSELSLCSL
jgi:hypothetical protein